MLGKLLVVAVVATKPGQILLAKAIREARIAILNPTEIGVPLRNKTRKDYK